MLVEHVRRMMPVLFGGAVAAILLGTAVPAAAHVTVSPNEATKGGYARLAFRVPTESATANTVRLEVVLPEANPLRSVSTMPVPGWSVTAERRTLDSPIKSAGGAEITEVVSRLVWTASADAVIRPGQFQEFPVSLGPLPDVDTLVFRALQTYSDGTVVRWIEEPAGTGGEVEHPAPVLRLNAKVEASTASTGATVVPAGQNLASTDRDDNGAGAGVALGGSGLVAGLAGLTLGALALRGVRRRNDSATESG